MLRKLQSRLTYANVTSTLALFLALGGGAYAAIDLVGRNDIKSRHIAPGQVKLSDTNDRLRLKCPGGTTFHEGACIETVARGSANQDNADSTCRGGGRRLPDPAELVSFSFEPGNNVGGVQPEWTLVQIRDEDDGTAFVDWGIAIQADGSYDVFAKETTIMFRCVARPKR